jgi:HAD superfamily hydrolase (TIGR01490 family)
MNATVAIFDLDGTITRRDTYLAFLRHVLMRRRTRMLHCFGLPMTVLRFKLGRVTNEEIKCAFLKSIIGDCTRKEIEEFSTEFVAGYFSNMVKPGALTRIDWHRSRGHLLVLATASFDFYAEAIGQSLGFDHVIATRAVWRNERVTGDIEGENLRGEAKLAAVVRVLGQLDCEISRVIAYSDDHSDLPILRFADQGVAIDPKPKLAVVAQDHGLGIEAWNCSG